MENIYQLELKINEIDIEIAKASNNYTASNPFFLNLLNEKNTLSEQKKSVEKKIENLPISQQQYIDLYRDLEISEQVYKDLLAKRLEFSIREASTIGNVRIIDDGYMDYKVSPRLISLFYWFALFSVFSIGIAIIRGLYFLPVTNPAELADFGLKNPILSVVPLVDEDESSANEEKFTQAMESMVLNIDTILENKKVGHKGKVVVFTSPTPQNGKSYISRNYAQKLAKLNKKVVLIDCDLKRGVQHKEFGMQKLPQEKFRNLNEENIDSIKISDNFYLVPKISSLKSSFQLLYSPEFFSKLEMFKEIFDYIIIDTPPILSVSDASVMLSYGNCNVLITRHNFSNINQIKQTVHLSSQIGISIDGFIYNAYFRPDSYYGYYSVYGNYEYQYYAEKYLYEEYDYDKKS